MLKKRLIGVVTVKNGWAVQSFGYKRYLPLGKPEILLENLDRWGADEIILQCIDRTPAGRGPDFDLLKRIMRRGIATPLIYAGGIRNLDDGVEVIKAGADRIILDALLWDSPEKLFSLSNYLGAQAIVASLPVSLEEKQPVLLDYRSNKSKLFDRTMIDFLNSGAISEIMITDWQHEGYPNSFDMELLYQIPKLINIPAIAFGGLSQVMQLYEILGFPYVAAVAIGNFLTYREHAIQAFKKELVELGLPLRPAFVT